MNRRYLLPMVILLLAGCSFSSDEDHTKTVFPNSLETAVISETTTATSTLISTPTPFPSSSPIPTLNDPPVVLPTSVPTTILATPVVVPLQTTSTPTPSPNSGSLDLGLSISPTSAITIESIGNLSPGDDEVTIEGRVMSTSSFSHGFKFSIDDGTGQITLLLWHDVYDDFWDKEDLNLGATVRVRGLVADYEGELQIEPDFASQIQLLIAGSGSAPQIDIGNLVDHMGERVMISGTIQRIETTDFGVKLFVADETGEILVFIWQNVLERIPNATTLGIEGTDVIVVGTVQEFRSNREVVPSLPYDVKING